MDMSRLRISIECLLKNPDYKKFKKALEFLIENNEVKFEERPGERNRLPEKYWSLPRIEYILKKWLREKKDGKTDPTIYSLGEENIRNFKEKITAVR